MTLCIEPLQNLRLNIPVKAAKMCLDPESSQIIPHMKNAAESWHVRL